MTSRNELVNNRRKTADSVFVKIKFQENVFQAIQELWMLNAVQSLRKLVGLQSFKIFFTEFLKTEFCEDLLESYLTVQQLNKLKPDEMKVKAKFFYQELMGYEENSFNSETLDNTENLMKIIREEAENSLKMLAALAFPRFLLSSTMERVFLSLAIVSYFPSDSIYKTLKNISLKKPTDDEDWLKLFLSLIETTNASIVISDMTTRGAPIVYVNDQFSITTGYKKPEVTGRSCRFLQGPETEADAIEVLKYGIANGKDCSTRITNYRKNGDLFQHYVSLKPVFDSENNYIYVIGILLSQKEETCLNFRSKLDKMLKLIPSVLNAQNMHAIITDSTKTIKKRTSSNIIDVKELVAANSVKSEKATYRTIFAFTKIMWLNKPVESMLAIISDPIGREMFSLFTGITSMVYQYNFDFCCYYDDICKLKGDALAKVLGELRNSKHRVNHCMRTLLHLAIPLSNDMSCPEWMQFKQEADRMNEISVNILSSQVLIYFMNSKLSQILIAKLREREVRGETHKLCTVATGLDVKKDSSWMDLFRVMAESMSVGMLISDMTIPGLPLAYINEGFRTTTGYGKEKIGSNCRFLQGLDTQNYLNDQIKLALQRKTAGVFKLNNYQSNGQMFQCLLALHPVFGSCDEYKYQIGLQLNFSLRANITSQLVEMDRALRTLPYTTNILSSLSCTNVHEDDSHINPVDYMGDATLSPRWDPQTSGQSTMTADSLSYRAQVSSCEDATSLMRHTMTSFTRIMWLQDPVKACRGVLLDDECRRCFLVFAEKKCSLLTCNNIKFVESMKVLGTTSPLSKRNQLLRSMHKVYENNILFYCTTNEIPVGQLDSTDWGSIYENMCVWQEQTIVMLATDAFQRFLEDPSSTDMIVKLQQREAAGEELPLQTAGWDVGYSERHQWLDMFRIMADSLSIGMVLSDMTVPGLPLVFINEGFRAVTGYGKEMIGTNCRFLQGSDTQHQSLEEIRMAIQRSEPLLVKLHNYKADGQKFQCLLALHPVFGPAPEHEYKYMIGMQLDFNDQDPDLQSKMAEFARVLRYLPQTVNGSVSEPARAKIQTLDNLYQSQMQWKVGLASLSSRSSLTSGITRRSTESKDLVRQHSSDSFIYHSISDAAGSGGDFLRGSVGGTAIGTFLPQNGRGVGDSINKSRPVGRRRSSSIVSSGNNSDAEDYFAEKSKFDNASAPAEGIKKSLTHIHDDDKDVEEELADIKKSSSRSSHGKGKGKGSDSATLNTLSFHGRTDNDEYASLVIDTVSSPTKLPHLSAGLGSGGSSPVTPTALMMMPQKPSPPTNARHNRYFAIAPKTKDTTTTPTSNTPVALSLTADASIEKHVSPAVSVSVSAGSDSSSRKSSSAPLADSQLPVKLRHDSISSNSAHGSNSTHGSNGGHGSSSNLPMLHASSNSNSNLRLASTHGSTSNFLLANRRSHLSLGGSSPCSPPTPGGYLDSSADYLSVDLSGIDMDDPPSSEFMRPTAAATTGRTPAHTPRASSRGDNNFTFNNNSSSNSNLQTRSVTPPPGRTLSGSDSRSRNQGGMEPLLGSSHGNTPLLSSSDVDASDHSFPVMRMGHGHGDSQYRSSSPVPPGDPSRRSTTSPLIRRSRQTNH